MSDLNLDALEKLCEEASPAPWTADDGGQDDWCIFDGTGQLCFDIGWEASKDGVHPKRPDADARFIAAARTALPVLIKRVRELENHIDMIWNDESGRKLMVKLMLAGNWSIK